jgi:site-specific DNA-methyltransferase (cytosine-N4-specific)
LGRLYCGKSEEVLQTRRFLRHKGKVQLVFTSPPFPLNRKKKYGNLSGTAYAQWLAAFASILAGYLTPDGSIVIELGNAWENGRPTMSTLPLETLLAFKEAAKLYLCQEFICFNPARLPSPAQWVNVERCRVKDSFTRLWWLSPTDRPKADNRRVLQEYSDSMKKLLKSGRYNAGRRPSEHHIGEESFLTNNGGAIPSNVMTEGFVADLLTIANTKTNDPYQVHCRRTGREPHPARMPLQVPEFFVKLLTDAGDLVLDPFAGSNTTGRSAENLRRRWISIEVDSAYAEGSRGRFQTLNRCRRIAAGRR